MLNLGETIGYSISFNTLMLINTYRDRSPVPANHCSFLLQSNKQNSINSSPQIPSACVVTASFQTREHNRTCSVISVDIRLKS